MSSAEKREITINKQSVSKIVDRNIEMNIQSYRDSRFFQSYAVSSQ